MNRQELETKFTQLKKKESECQEELKKVRLEILNISKQLIHNIVGYYFKDRNLAYYKIVKDLGSKIKYIIVIPNDDITVSDWHDKQIFLDRVEASNKKEFERVMYDTYNYLIEL